MARIRQSARPPNQGTIRGLPGLMGDHNSDSTGSNHSNSSETRDLDKGVKSKKRQHGPDPVANQAKKRRTIQKKPAPPSNRLGETWAATVLAAPAEPDSEPSPEPSPPAPAKQHSHSRTRHNLVEQKYRQRLNQQFKHLLDILPASMRERDGHHPPLRSSMSASPRATASVPTTTTTGLPSPPLAEPPKEPHHQLDQRRDLNETQQNQNESQAQMALVDRGERRVSKAEVLDRARLYIQSLEREYMRLVAERRELDLMWGEHCRREAEALGGGRIGGLPGLPGLGSLGRG